ncbi:MAG: hypothetical protein LUQ65_03720 [Candidatus Helarchaeota archaeon]|nr:hypothetical protein [Candidatus Helarchaeota archaeon]
MPTQNVGELKEQLNRVLELAILIEKDISGVRLRSPDILKQEQLKEQVDLVIKSIEEDMKKVENGIPPLKKYFALRSNALSSMGNLIASLKDAIDSTLKSDEITESLRLFSKAAQEEFVLTIIQLEKLWNQEIMDIMESMKKVISIMQVTQEKIIRYKRECNIQEDLESDLGNLMDYLLKGEMGKFKEAEKDLRSRILPED